MSIPKRRCGICRAVEILLGAAEDQAGRVRDYIAPDHLRVAIEPEENDDAEILISEGWLGGGDRKIFAAHFRIARSANSPSAISCWSKQSARSFPRG